MYNNRTFLNSSIGNANIECVCNNKLEKYKQIFVSISDCSNTVFIHPIKNENGDVTIEDYIEKLSRISLEIYNFVMWLENNKEEVKEMEVFKK